MPGKKTHEQQIRTFERKPDLPDRRQVDTALARDTQGSDGILRPRQGASERIPSEFWRDEPGKP
jgi:hypothetical protein